MLKNSKKISSFKVACISTLLFFNSCAVSNIAIPIDIANVTEENQGHVLGVGLSGAAIATTLGIIFPLFITKPIIETSKKVGMNMGETLELKIKVTNPRSGNELTLLSKDKNILKVVSQKTRLVRAISPGKTSIYVTYGNSSENIEVTVYDNTIVK